MNRIALLVLLTSALAAAEAPVSPSTPDLVATIDGEAIHLNELVVGPLVLNDVAAKPQLANGVLTFNECQAACYGGVVQGSIAMDLPGNRTRVAVKIQGVDLASLLAAFGSTSDAYSGVVDAQIDLAFPTNDVRKAEGRAQGAIADGNLVEMSFLTNLLVGNIGNVRGQDTAAATAEIHDGEVRLSSARITFPNGSALISGTVALDGGLRLLVIPKVKGGILSQVWFVGKWFGAALAFASSHVARAVVRGTISRPVVVLNPFAGD